MQIGRGDYLEFFQPQLQLFYLPEHLLALGSEQQPLELGDEQLEALDLNRARTQRLLVASQL